ncbi:DUF4231 domain-containing protein [Photobacterium galatheae]|uniref:SMODS and SLOG-associating 2TM effector domain-containing protein n=1 Tax=Photobacterium galatheae TaxID=1654360 RepID=A0A066RVM6_9GAMM|nr:DUF4231 domain-containing protein [Photobacterium galatheae]KDM93141.1 hypothetical protein EA58_02820 [Photobacterium galatheae]MCM0148331.1 DUF4231 domain-containing protein [Photobacterium galatheae]
MSAREYSTEQAEHFKKKADHNKIESLWCFRIIMLSTLSAPLLVSLNEGIFYAKVLPSIFSAVAAFCTAWLQLRKPQELWSIYRNAQRQIEMQITHFDFNVAEYTGLDENKANEQLALNVSNLVLETNNRWTKNVPNPSNLKIESN